jgi:hypothetical protein
MNHVHAQHEALLAINDFSPLEIIPSSPPPFHPHQILLSSPNPLLRRNASSCGMPPLRGMPLLRGFASSIAWGASRDMWMDERKATQRKLSSKAVAVCRVPNGTHFAHVFLGFLRGHYQVAWRDVCDVPGCLLGASAETAQILGGSRWGWRTPAMKRLD